MDWNLAERRLYLCTPDRPDLADFVTLCVRGGVDIVQLREKSLDDRSILRRAVLLKELCSELGVPFILNDRPDLALAAGADGVHVGQDDLPVAVARKIVGKDAIVGLSTHCDGDLEAALDQPVDYISAGPIVATPTKPGRSGTGTAYAVHASQVADVPVFVTGGVSADRVGELFALGITHFVSVRSLTESDNPFEEARKMRDAIEASIATSQANALRE
ncbi:MAG: thiamine phosphate synthase [Actinobacteria bacterium]|jgi:thiamine-phosphate pyrophosphorylase|nr:thiamine phosphate synthase [Actinomycetota bacterium]MCL5444811.1 thiamine phosphate synthase [Actinomycetota bacterium]